MNDLEKRQLLKKIKEDGSVEYARITKVNDKTYTINYYGKLRKDTLLDERGDKWEVVTEEEREKLLEVKNGLVSIKNLIKEAKEVLESIEKVKGDVDSFKEDFEDVLDELNRIV